MKIFLKGLVLLPCYIVLYPLGILKNKIEDEILKTDLVIDKILLYFIIFISYIPGVIANIFEKWE
jgi:hypothetical protein